MLQKATPGQPAVSSPLGKAAFVNDLVDIRNAFRGSDLGSPSPTGHLAVPTDLVKVKNISGADRLQGAVLQLGTLLLTAIDRRNPWFNAAAPAVPSHEQYAILREPIESNGMGWAQVSGVCVARVNVGNTLHTHAFPTASAYVLTSEMAGPIELLSPPDGTGEQEMFVRLAVTWPILLGKTDASHAAGASGTISIWSGTPGSETDTTVNVTDVWNSYADLETTKWCSVAWQHGKPYLIAGEC